MSTLGQELTATLDIAQERRVETQQAVQDGLRGDLDWIVMKALEKDRTRRYETANGFAADIKRHLAGEPVLAAPPSAAYRLRKFVARRKGTVVAVVAMTLLLIAGSVGTAIGWLRAADANEQLSAEVTEKEKQRHLAVENAALATKAEAKARQEEKRALEAEAEARQRADEFEQVAKFQEEQLTQIEPEVMGVHLRRSLLDAVPEDRREKLAAILDVVDFTTLAVESLDDNLLDRSLEAIELQFAEMPRLRARLLIAVGWTLCGIGLVEKGVKSLRSGRAILQAELGDDDEATVTATSLLVSALVQLSRDEEALPMARELVARCERLYGPDDARTLMEMLEVADILHRSRRDGMATRRMRLEVLRRYKARLRGTAASVEEAYWFGTLRNNLALGLSQSDQPQEAEALAREHLAAAKSGGLRESLAMANLGSILWDAARGLPATDPNQRAMRLEAVALIREALARTRQLRGEEHPQTVMGMAALGGVLGDLGELQEAEALYRKCLQLCRRVYGSEHRQTWGIASSLAGVLLAQRRIAEAEPLARGALAAHRREFGDGHPREVRHAMTLGEILLAQRQLDEARDLFEEALRLVRIFRGPSQLSEVSLLGALGVVAKVSGQLGEAERLFSESVQVLEKRHGESAASRSEEAKQLAAVRELIAKQGGAAASPTEGPRGAFAALPVRDTSARTQFVWQLLEAEVESERDPALALELAQQLDKDTRGVKCGPLQVLAEALYANGQKDEAKSKMYRAMRAWPSTRSADKKQLGERDNGWMQARLQEYGQ